MALEPYVQSGMLTPDLLSPLTMELPGYMSSPMVGGTVPPRGPARVTGGDVRTPPYDRQPSNARRFNSRPLSLPGRAQYF